MSEHDLEKLLGGFAADTLTAEEQQQLYAAALHDQELFNALADEQALRELLSDPVVRRRLLQSLQASSSAMGERSPSWFDWSRRPAGLAWAGGVAAAVFAVILGSRIYQDSAKETGRSIATEETTPAAAPASEPSATQTAAPPINDLRSNAHDNTTKSSNPPRKEALAGKMATQETTTMVNPARQQAAADSEPDALREPSRSTPDKLPQSEEQPASADQNHATAPASSASVPAPTKAPDTATVTGEVDSARLARSLFYGAPAEIDSGLAPGEQERSPYAQQFEQLERKGSPSGAGQTAKSAGAAKPLGIRYSLVTNGIEGSHGDRDAGAPIHIGSVDLMIEANQDGFFQVLGEADSLEPHLLFPFSTEDPLSSRLMAYQRRRIPILAGYRSVTVRMSRMPFDTLSTKDPDEIKRSPLRQVQETSTFIGASGSQEQTTYVVNRDPSVAMLVVRIPIHQP